MSAIIPLPHAGSPDAGSWAHVRAGTWTGGHGSPSMPVPQVSDREGVHLARAGSNSALTGFETPEEAEAYRADWLDETWSVVDRRDPELPSP